MWQRLSTWLQTRDLERQWRRLQKEPSELALRGLISLCQEHNDAELALRAVRHCLEHLPKSSMLEEWERLCQRWVAENACDLAEEDLAESPTADAYLRLARACLDLRDMPRVYTALEACTQQFPENAEGPRLLAKVLYRRFKRDLFARDGQRVHDLLHQALEADPDDAPTHFLLARFLADVGLYLSARREAKIALDLDPKFTEARSLHVGLGAVCRGDDESSLESELAHIETCGRLQGSGDDLENMRTELTSVRADLPSLEQRTRALRTAILDANGDAWDERGELGSDAFVEMARSLSRTALRTVRETGFGPLLGVSIEADAGHLVLRKGRRTVTAALLPCDADLANARQAIDAFTAAWSV